MPKIEVPFDKARPGITHLALYELQQAGILKFIVSQVIDYPMIHFSSRSKFLSVAT